MEREPAGLYELLGDMSFGKRLVGDWIRRSWGFLRERAEVERFNVYDLDFEIICSERRGSADLLIGESRQAGYSLGFSVGVSGGEVKMVSASILTNKGLFWRRKYCDRKEDFKEILFGEGTPQT
jgi:hypothetical protein